MSTLTPSKFLVLAMICGCFAALPILATIERAQANPDVLDPSAPYRSDAQHLSDRATMMLPTHSLTTTSQSDTLDEQLQRIIRQHGLTGDPADGRELPSIEDPVVQLGKKLFFSKTLGGDMDVACASCHLPTLGGGDGLPMSIGVGAPEPDLIGPGRTHPALTFTVPRNAPTTFNIALWDKVLFHDGRIESLGGAPGVNGADGKGIRTPDVTIGEVDPNAGANLAAAQSRFPTTSPEEMRGFAFAASQNNQYSRDQLATRLAGHSVDGLDEGYDWRAAFEIAFGPAERAEGLITEQYIAEAIGEYERSQIFIETPWKAYVEGDLDALTDAAKRGAWIFFTPTDEGGANCARCHSGDFFTDEAFHVLAVPQIGRGKGDGLAGTGDYGRFRETRQLKDLYAFRTPSLINVTVTGPWGHDGAFKTLEGMVRHTLNPAESIRTYDWAQLDEYVFTEDAPANTQKALARLAYNRRMGVMSVENVDLTNVEVADLLAFLEALTDPCVTDAACLAPWMPSHEEMELDDHLLNAQLAVDSR